MAQKRPPRKLRCTRGAGPVALDAFPVAGGVLPQSNLMWWPFASNVALIRFRIAAHTLFT